MIFCKTSSKQKFTNGTFGNKPFPAESETVLMQKYENKPRINKGFYHRFHVWFSPYVSLIKLFQYRIFSIHL